MDFKAFKGLTAEGDTKTSFDKLMNVYREIDRIKCLYSGHSVYSETTLQRQIQAGFDGLSNDQKADPLQPARGYLSNLKEHQLEPLEANSLILEDILEKMHVKIQAKKWLRPAMSSLLNKSTQDLQTIQGALYSLDGKQFKSFLNNFDKMASRIAGQNRNRLTDTYKILMDKLAEYDGNDDITVQLNAAYDEVAQKCQNLNPLQRGLSVLKGLLSREPSLQTLPQTLVNPFASESPAAVSDAPATPTSETPSEEVTTSASAPAAEAASEPTSQQLQNPLQKLGQTILSLPVISQIKRGVLGLTAAAVIATEPLQKLINKHRKGLLISGSGVAGVLGLGVLAAKNLGSVPAVPAVDLAELTNGTPRINIALETIKNDFTNTKPGWVSLEAYLAQPKINVINNSPQNNDAIKEALITLKASMAKGGMASSNQAVKGATRDSIENIAELTGINQEEFVRAYTDARDAVNGNILNGQQVTNDVHTQAVYHEKMGKALDALSEKITASRSSEGSTVTFSGGHGGGGGNETLIASGPVSDISSSGILPAQHQSPLATMMQGAVSRLEGVAHNVAVVAQHPAAQAAMKTLGVVGVVASVTATVHAARNGQKSLAVMNAATAVATAAATVGMPPLAAVAGGVRVAAFVKDRSGEEALLRVTAQKEKLANKLATLKAEPQTLGSQVQTVTTNVALATKTADVFASQQLNALRENGQLGMAATSQMFTQAQEVAETTMQTASNIVQSTRNRVAAFFTQRQTAAAL